MNIRYLLGIVLVLGIAFLGVFLTSPSINTVQADEFVLLDGYSGEFVSSDASHAFTYYHIQIPEGKDVVVDVPDAFIAIDGYFYHTRNGLITYDAPLGAEDQFANRKLIHLDNENSKYEFLVAYLEDGSVDFSKSILAVVPEEYYPGRPIDIEAPPQSAIGPSEWKDLKSDEDLSNIPAPKNPTTGFAAEVCFNPGLIDLPQTGLCDYLTISTYQQLGQVEANDIPRIIELLEATFEGKKKSPMADYEDSRFVVSQTSDSNPTIIYNPENEITEIDGKVVEKNTNQEIDSENDVKNSEESSLNEIQAASGSKTPVVFSPLQVKEAKLFSSPTKILLQSSTTRFYEDFEGAFPSGNWSVSDVDSGNGSDYWDDTAVDSHLGTWSAWAADIGDQWSVVSSDLFSSSISGWTAVDQNPNSGLDTWGQSTYRYSSSPGSAYAAGNSSTSAAHLYDNDMTALLTKNSVYNASTWGANNVRVRFSTWYQTVSPNDYLAVIFSGNGGSNYTVSNCTYAGSSGWQERICTVPSQFLTSQFKFGFLFISDSGNVLEGAYLDDVYLERYVSNSSIGKYDDYQESRLQYGPVSVGGYTGTVFDFWIKGNIEDCCDAARVELSSDGSNWQPVGSIIQTDFGTWQQRQYPFTSLSGNIYFRIIFDSDYSVRDSGYYIDDVKVWGYALLPNGSPCSSASQCQTGVCGGAHTDYRIHCNTDGSSSVFGDERIFEDTCGGAGQLSQTNTDAANGTCSSNKVCDADLSYYNSTFTTSQICKTNIPFSCGVTSDCWNSTTLSNGNVLCKGNTSKICTTGLDGSYCTENAQCNSNQCISNQCSTGIPNGSACTTDSACASKFCVANICSATHSPKVVRTDTWTQANSNGISDENDGHVFVNQSVYPNVTGLREETDMVCYDFDGNGVYDACYFDNNGCGGGGCTANSCNYFPIPQNVQNKYSCDIDSPTGCRIGLDGGTQAKICSGANCAVNTSQGSNYRQIIAKSYTDCDNTANLRAEVSPTAGVNGDYYYVYHSKYYKAEDTSLNQKNYFETGQWGYSDTNSNEYILHQCTGNTAVDVVAEESRVTMPNGVIPNVCKKVPGEQCSTNSECLYNICSNSQCVLSGGIKGHLIDETGHPIAGKVMKLTTCNNTLVAQSTTDASGKYSFYAPAGSYKQKTTAPWGEVTFVWAGEPSGCHSFGTGFNIVWSQLYTRANIHGRALDPLGNPSTNLPFEAATCQNVVLDTDTTDFQGNFDLSTDTGYQKINVNLNGNKFPITTQNGNACLFQYGEVDLGNIEVTANCSLYDNTCSDINPDVRLYNCQSSSANGCSCTTQICAAGCTEGASACNVVGTGTIKVTVMDVNGSPVPYAEIRSNGASVGKTNGWGKKDINVQHGSYSVKVTCPGDPLSQTKSVYINSNQKYLSYQMNCPTQPKGDLILFTRSPSGNPIANVYVYVNPQSEDDQEIGLTNGLGFLVVQDIEYGQHNIIVRYLDGDANRVFEIVNNVDINGPKNIRTIITPTSETQGTSYGVRDITSSHWLLTVLRQAFFSLSIAVNQASIAYAPVLGPIGGYQLYNSTLDLCDCYAAHGISRPICTSFIIDNYSPVNAELSVSSQQFIQGANPEMLNACALEQAIIVLDVFTAGETSGARNVATDAATGVLGKKATVVGIDQLSQIGKHGGEIKAVQNSAEKVIFWTDSFWDLAHDVGIAGSKIDYQKAKAINTLVENGVETGKFANFAVAREKLTSIKEAFGEDKILDFYDAIGKAISRPDYSPTNITWVAKTNQIASTFNPAGGSVGTFKGNMNEALVAFKKNIINKMSLGGFAVHRPNGSTVTDLDILDGTILREVKGHNSLYLDALEKFPNVQTITSNHIVSVIDDKVRKLDEAKLYLPQGITFDQVHFNIAVHEGEGIPTVVREGLDDAVASDLIDYWEEVFV